MNTVFKINKDLFINIIRSKQNLADQNHYNKNNCMPFKEI